MRKQAFLISSRNTGKLFSILQIKHSGKGSDPNARITTGFQWQEHIRKHHRGKTKLRVILPHEEEYPNARKVGKKISPNTPMFSPALAPGQVTHRGRLRLASPLKGSEVHKPHAENTMEQLHSTVPPWPHCGQEPHLLGNCRQPKINLSVLR